MLHHLLRNPDVVLSKSAIPEAVWDSAFEGDVNIVEVYIGHLRRKIDTPFAQTSIRTFRGSGYLLSPTDASTGFLTGRSGSSASSQLAECSV